MQEQLDLNTDSADTPIAVPEDTQPRDSTDDDIAAAIAAAAAEDHSESDFFIPLADRIKSAFDDALATLIAKRDQQYADGIKPLDAEQAALVEEHASIGEAAENLRELLPAREREAQREADGLIVSGQLQEAKAKITEMEQARHAPVAMNERQREISARIHEIDAEKKAIAKRVFEEWYGQLQPVVRAAEHGLFITAL